MSNKLLMMSLCKETLRERAPSDCLPALVRLNFFISLCQHFCAISLVNSATLLYTVAIQETM